MRIQGSARRWAAPALAAAMVVAAGHPAAAGETATGAGGAAGRAASAGAGGAAGAAAAASAERVAALEAAVEVLTGEVARLRDGGATPAAAAEASPGAEKVFTSGPGVSLGGYGEFYFTAPSGDGAGHRVADYHRFITYVGAKFSDRVLMNTELEFEHGSTEENPSGETGSVSLEFSYLDFLVAPGAHVRAGSVLLPVGFTNRVHEPPFRRGNVRPTVEKAILPTTWRELGAGAQVARGPLRLDAYVVNGLDAIAFRADGIRDGRQSGNHALWEDLAVAVAAGVETGAGLTAGGSVVTGQADQGRVFDGRKIDAGVTVYEAHVEARRGPVRARALFAGTSIAESEAISAEVGETVPERQTGGYVELGLQVGRFAGIPSGQEILLWGRVEDWNLQQEVAGGAAADPALEATSVAGGIEYFPDPSVVVKLDATRVENEAGAVVTSVRLGAGFVY